VVPIPIVKYAMLATVAVYPIVAVGSITYGLTKLCTPSISNESRRIVMTRHVLTIIGFIVATAFPFIFMISLLLDLKQGKVMFYSSFFFASSGIYMPLLRTAEPYFFSVVKQNLRTMIDFICCRKRV
jgi:hypothetical protein